MITTEDVIEYCRKMENACTKKVTEFYKKKSETTDYNEKLLQQMKICEYEGRATSFQDVLIFIQQNQDEENAS